jgi:hypothetical protein
MKTRGSALLIGIVLLAVPPSQAARAASPGVPVSLYPAGAHVRYRANLSNHELDCMWGFLCDGAVPLFHTYTQDQLHRVSGWAQFAGVRRHGHMLVAFELFSSTYQDGGDLDGTPFSKEAFDDLVRVTRTRGYTSLLQKPRLLPGSSDGDSMMAVERTPGSALVVMACWSGTGEIEAIVMVNHATASARRVAVRELASQIRWAAGRT